MTQLEADLASTGALLASYGGCPNRTVWMRVDDTDFFKCTCCGTTRRLDRLDDPWPVDLT